MERNWKLRSIFIVFLVLAAIVLLIPTFVNLDKYPALKKVNEGISLGLDLKGGIHFVLSVDIDKAVQDKVDRMTDEISKRMDDEKIAYESVKSDPVDPVVTITLKEGVDKNAFNEKIVDFYRNLKRVGQTGNEYRFAMRDDSVTHIKESAVEQALETLRSRIDELGLKEPIVARQGKNAILIQLPGYKDIERARSIIGQTAQLEFKIVADDRDPLASHVDSAPAGVVVVQRGPNHVAISEDKDLLNNYLQGKAPEGTEFRLEENFRAGKVEYQSYLLERKAYLSGDMLTDARVSINQQKNEPYVSLSFDRNGARIFEEVTGKFTKRRLAIVLDDKVKSAPTIIQKIVGGNAMITLNSAKGFNELFKEAKDLALVLRAGSLPAPVTFEENRTVGPSLGHDSIQKGKNSIMLGFFLVMVFMLIYYGKSGIVANVALLLNVLFVLAALAMFGATLTFPGIAGIVLTLGMAVDANVIIYERMREELKIGRSTESAIENGYDKAWSAIFDANLTTGIAAFILWNFGSGPIKGFAITLLLGIISSMFTAIFVTRVIFQGFLKAGVKKLSL